MPESYIGGASSGSVIGSGNDHGFLFGLTDDDHTQYVHTSTARTITAAHTLQQGNISTAAIYAQATGDTTPRYALLADGTHEWGPGNGARDVTLSRSSANKLVCAGALGASRSNATDAALYVQLATDTVAPFAVLADGKHEWGAGGSSARDVTLHRSAANTLTLTGKLAISSTLDVTGVLGLSSALWMNGSILFASDAELAAHLTPDATGTYDLGTSSRQFRNAYVGTSYSTTKTYLASNGGTYATTSTVGSGGSNVYLRLGTGTQKVHVSNAGGLIIQSPDNNYWAISVSNAGALSATSIGASLP